MTGRTVGFTRVLASMAISPSNSELRGDKCLDFGSASDFYDYGTSLAHFKAHERAAQLLQGDELVDVLGHKRHRIEMKRVAFRKLVDLDRADLKPLSKERPPLPLRVIQSRKIAEKGLSTPAAFSILAFLHATLHPQVVWLTRRR